MSSDRLVERLTAALDELAAADPADLDDPALRTRLIGLATTSNRLQVELARTAERFDRRGLASLDGFRTARTWLQAVCRLSGKLAHRLVKSGRLLARLPKMSTAAQGGQVSVEHVQQVSRLTDQVGLAQVTRVEATLADAAQMLDPARFGVVCDRVQAHVDPDGPDPVRDHQRRGLKLSPVGRMQGVRGQLDAEGGATLQVALDALMSPPGESDDRTPAQRRADALVELARRHLTAGTLPTVGGQRPQVGVLLQPQALSPRTLATLAAAQTAPVGRQRLIDLATTGRTGAASPAAQGAQAAQAVPPVPAAQAAQAVRWPQAVRRPQAGEPARADPAGGAAVSTPAWSRLGWADPPWLAWHGPISPVTAQRIACDADIWRVIIDPTTSQPLDVGRAHRIVPHWIRKALYARDRGCRWPGCPTPAEWTDAHHLTPWADGGETSARQCILLCRHHHVLVHEGRWRIHLDHTGEAHITRPGGIPYQLPTTRSQPWVGPSG